MLRNSTAMANIACRFPRDEDPLDLVPSSPLQQGSGSESQRELVQCFGLYLVQDGAEVHWGQDDLGCDWVGGRQTSQDRRVHIFEMAVTDIPSTAETQMRLEINSAMTGDQPRPTSLRESC
ncbi:hypothetical protein LEMLEM_LOCUS978 [Lemmus lemmus]